MRPGSRSLSFCLFSGAEALLVRDTDLVTEICPSPNHGERRGCERPDHLILHYTGMKTGAEALARLCDPQAEVSCHYFIWENGSIVQMVPENRRAWHAGQSSWAGVSDLNSRSIGIEIVNSGHDWLGEGGQLPVFPAEQIAAVIRLCADLLLRHPISPRAVLAHSDIAPGRKSDPGEKFPWEALAKAGIGHWVAPAPLSAGVSYGLGDEGPPIRAVQALLSVYGYDLTMTGVFDAATERVVRAFQRHFRPALVDGRADFSTLQTLRNLVTALPSV